jgi:riboflavin synthase
MESWLTVVALKDTSYTVTAIDETIKKQTWKLGSWRQRQPREKAMKLGD